MISKKERTSLTLGSGTSFEGLSIINYKDGALIRDTNNRNLAYVFVKHIKATNITVEDCTKI